MERYSGSGSSFERRVSRDPGCVVVMNRQNQSSREEQKSHTTELWIVAHFEKRGGSVSESSEQDSKPTGVHLSRFGGKKRASRSHH